MMPVLIDKQHMCCEHETHRAAAAASGRMHSTVLDMSGWQFCFLHTTHK
jgi:hypothetical protein